MKLLRSLSLATLALAGATVCAQTMKPGLWEITQKTQFGASGMNDQMAAVQQQMANLPPEQKKMMQDMMAKQGMQMGNAGPGGMSIKTCMTKEMIDRHELPAGEGECTSTLSPRTGNTQKIAFTCTKPPSSGEGQITYSGAEGYTTKMKINTTVRGKAETMDMEGSGKWLATDCGDIKPFRLPKK